MQINEHVYRLRGEGEGGRDLTYVQDGVWHTPPPTIYTLIHGTVEGVWGGGGYGPNGPHTSYAIDHSTTSQTLNHSMP